MKYYDFKTVLGSLRGEYLKNQKELNSLKRTMETIRNNDSLYLCSSKVNDNDKVSLSYVIDTNLHQDRASDRTYTMTGTIYDGNTEKIYDPTRFLLRDESLIKEKMKELDKTEFSNNMNMSCPDTFRSKDGSVLHNLVVWTYLLEIVLNNKCKLVPETIVFYRPYEDRFYIDRNNPFQRVNDNFVREVMSTPIPEHLFKTYHKDIMDKYPDKELVIENSKKNNICNKYEIIDEENRLILRR